MFEKLSGFFKQFTSRRKRQSGETTIMESKEPGVDEFGLDEGFGDIDTFGDDAGSDVVGDLDLDTFGDAAGAGNYPETSGLADTGGFDDSDSEQGGDVSAQFDAQTGAEGSVEEAFSDFSATSGETDFDTGGTDFDERTVSDEISGPAGAEFDDTGGDFGGAFDVGDEGVPLDAGAGAPKASSPVKTILTVVVAATLAVGVGAAFQIFAWPSVSAMVGLSDAGELKIEPEAQLSEENRKKVRLTKELGEFKKVGAPAQVQTLKTEIAEIRDAQGAVEEIEAGFEAVKAKEAEYDGLNKRISKLEANIRKTGLETDKVKADIELTGQQVVELAKQTDVEYERFSFELARAELGQRLLIELQLRDIASFRSDVTRLEERLSKLSAQALTVASVEAVAPDEAASTETFGN